MSKDGIENEELALNVKFKCDNKQVLVKMGIVLLSEHQC